MKNETIYLSQKLAANIKRKDQIFNIKLKNGEIIKDLVFDEQGKLLGMYVGGQDGIQEISPTFMGDEIVAIQISNGLLAALNLRNWMTA